MIDLLLRKLAHGWVMALLAGAVACGTNPLIPSLAWAESAVRLPPPHVFGKIAAGTYDEDGRRVGPAAMGAERLQDGRVRLSVESGFRGSARTHAEALLAPSGEDGALRILSQMSHSFDEKGEPMGILSIDHVKGVATCTAAPADGERVRRFALPPSDRVVNVPLTLLFQRLVTGDTKEVDFQVFVCTGGPRLLDARATRVSPASADHASRDAVPELVEVRYNVDLGPVLTSLVRPFVPRMSVWFDADDPSRWVGHRVPLYGRGPTVLVVRSGFSPGVLVANP